MLSMETNLLLTDTDQQLLLDVALQSINQGLQAGHCCAPHDDYFPIDLRRVQACFVSLQVDGEQRGCVGTTEAQHPLVIEVARNACSAALPTRQRSAVTEEEMPLLKITISVLSPLQHLGPSSLDAAAEALRPGVDGVSLRHGEQAATFLPEMWKQFPNPSDFLRELSSRAGLEATAWPVGTQLATFETQRFSRSMNPLPSKPK